MNFKTKFAINNKVFIITYQRIVKSVTCPNCNGQKQKNWQCQKCFDRGSVTEYSEPNWIVHENPYEIGMVKVELWDGNQKNSYMCKETGIGSGTVWSEDQLFGTKEKALKECEKRNDKARNL